MRPFRRRLVRLDRLILGADPQKLSAQTEIPSAVIPAPLTNKEQGRLSALATKRSITGPLTPAETYELGRLRSKRGIQGQGKENR